MSQQVLPFLTAGRDHINPLRGGFGKVLCYTPIPSYKTNDPDLWDCKTEWVHGA